MIQVFPYTVEPNVPALAANIRAAVPGAAVSWGAEEQTIYVEHPSLSEAGRPAIQAIIDAHDPAALAPEQEAQTQEQAAVEAAATHVNAADLQAVRQAIVDEPALSAATRQALIAWLRFTGRLARAAGHTPTEAGE